MTKSQHGNKEAKKPKQARPVVAPQAVVPGLPHVAPLPARMKKR